MKLQLRPCTLLLSSTRYPVAGAFSFLFAFRLLSPSSTLTQYRHIPAGTVVPWRIGLLSLSSFFHLALPRPSLGGSDN